MFARVFVFLCLLQSTAIAEPPHPAEGVVRFATYNVSLNRDNPGQLARELDGGHNVQARRIAEVIQRVRPHVLLLCEFDYDVAGIALERFHDWYLAKPQQGQAACEFPHRFVAPVNTGLATGFDLDRDGTLGGPGDAVGFGRHEGQYGMAVLSVFPFERHSVRTFQRFLWKDLPGALLPLDPATGAPYYSAAELSVLRLSSKSHWDVPVLVAGSSDRGPVHFVCAHPTPPVFDGPEDRNGRRNHDEIRMLAEYVTGGRGGLLVDDMGTRGGLGDSSAFIIAGDLNADPADGDSVPGAIDQLLEHPRVQAAPVPISEGGREAAQMNTDLNAHHRGDPAHDTADFGRDGVANLRCDYLLPSRELRVVANGVFWPMAGEPGSDAITASDHRLVWLDVSWSDPAP